MTWFLPLAAGLGSALAGIVGSNNASRAQTRAADSQLQLGREQMDLQREIYGDQRGLLDTALQRMTGAVGGTDQRAVTAANDAYRRQVQAAQQMAGTANEAAQTAFQGTQAAFNPYAQAGGAARDALQFNLGVGSRPAGYRGFQETPGFQFARDQGMNAIEGSAASRGGLLSGRTMRDAMGFSTGLANQEFGNYLGRLTGQQNMGLAAEGALAGARSELAGAQTNAGNVLGGMMAGAAGDRGNMLTNAANNRGNALMQAYQMWATGGANAGNAFGAGAGNAASMMGNALANLGDARAAGAVGTGNAITGGINNGLGLWSYLQNMQPAAGGGTGGGLGYGPR